MLTMWSSVSLSIYEYFVFGQFYGISSLRAGSHLGTRARAAKSEYSEAKWYGGEESGEKARRKWNIRVIIWLLYEYKPNLSIFFYT